jgi:Cu2+-exporting ATPase
MTAQIIRRQSASSFPSDAGPATAAAPCRHCGAELASDAFDSEFCCAGCAAAYGIVRGLGLESYYRRRSFDPLQRQLRPEPAAPEDFSAFVTSEPDGSHRIHLMVEGLHCAACVWLIEQVLSRQPDVVMARINMTTRRLVLGWTGEAARVNELAALVARLGYRLVPYDPAELSRATSERERELLRAMAVAGFAAGNVMLLSISVWAGFAQGMGPATRALLYWFSALIALPAIVYAGWPFFRSAIAAIRAGRVNMDVPISLAVILASAMSLYETATGGKYAYFDAAVTLLFFLLVGRYLDSRARSRARSSAERLVTLGAKAATVEEPSGARRMLPPAQVMPGMIVLAAAGERIAVDGRVREGESDVDTSLITGETVPARVSPGTRVFAGMTNLSGLLRIEVLGAGEKTLLAEIVRLTEAAEQGRARYVALADRVARAYVPAVHGFAAGTFLAWLLILGAPWQQALLNAIAVLIVTCPCALALAVPVVQVVASGRLLRQGILLKSATALERLAAVDTVVFDKTGTLTEGTPVLRPDPNVARGVLREAAALAGASRHPLARALHQAAPDANPPAEVEEIPGLGLRATTDGGEARLGSAKWCGVADESGSSDEPELWYRAPGATAVRFRFADALRADAATVAAELGREQLRVALLSGDRERAVAAAASAAGIEDFSAACTPAAKSARLGKLAQDGHRVLMVGDGLNDAPALAAAHVSMSPAAAADISRNAADVVFQGRLLAPVLETIAVARKAQTLVRENFALALLYNAVTVPLAMAGVMTPLIAALAMSSSSLIVTGNALRLSRSRSPWTSSSI